MSFHAGQKVVCVDDGPCPCTGRPVSLRKGSIYTIECTYMEHCAGETIPCVVVVEDKSWHYTKGYRAIRFGLVRTTSIEIFQRMLAPTPETV